MLDDPGEVLGACLKKLGHSINSADPAELQQASREAKTQKQLLRAYLNAEARDQLVSGDILGRATLRHHLPAGHRRRAVAQFRLSRPKVSRSMPITPPFSANPAGNAWRTNFSTTCYAPRSPPPSSPPPEPRPPIEPRSRSPRNPFATAPPCTPRPKSCDAANGSSLSPPPLNDCATGSGRRSNRHSLLAL
jgi:hypothetical protein